MIKILPTLAIVIALSLFSFLGHPQSREVILNNVKVYFSPNGGCTEAIVNELNKARGEVLM
jgi:hypothetical protein